MDNFDLLFDKIVSTFGESKRSLLLQACCAPCSSAVLERVTPFFDVTLYFYNPNITDCNEYKKRFNELERFVNAAYCGKVDLVDGGFDSQSFYAATENLQNEPERGARCTVCYRQRLYDSAAYAKKKGFEYFGSTLTVSPYKDSVRINSIGKELAAYFGINFLYSDFKKKNGYARSIELSKIYNLYRQNYCGCEYSKNQNSLKGY